MKSGINNEEEVQEEPRCCRCGTGLIFVIDDWTCPACN